MSLQTTEVIMADLFKTLKRINTDSIKWAMAKEETGSEDTLTFSVADSDYETAPEIKEALNDRVKHGAFGYARADKAYYEIVKDWMLRRYNIEVELPLPQNQIATRLAMQPETLSRLMRDMADEGVFELRRGRLFIPDRRELEERCR